MAYKDPAKQKEAQRKSYLKNIDKYEADNEAKRARVRGQIYTLKESTPCYDCHKYFPYYMTEYDHLDPSLKIDTVSRLARNSTLEKALEEIKKCELLCSNCHKQRTWLRSKLVQMQKQVKRKLEEKVSKNSAKRKDKRIQHATYVWEREQIQAAAALETLTKALEIIKRHEADLTPDQLLDVNTQADQQKEDIKEFLLKAKTKYENKLAELQ
jgi:hypothetical protein